MSIHPFRRTISLFSFSGALLLAVATAMAQVQPPMSGQQMPGGPTSPGMQPGNTPGNMPSTSDQASDTQGMSDRAFVKDALEGGMAEVQMGELAAQKGASNDVKSFGQQMVTDHTTLGNQMSQVAQGVGVTPPSGLSKKDKTMMTKLQGLSGSEFDDAYIRAMVKDHKKDDGAFKDEAENAQIPAVKQAAAQGERVIANHLQMIQQIAQAHNLGNAKSSGGGGL
jgi:putative membrane protein